MRSASGAWARRLGLLSVLAAAAAAAFVWWWNLSGSLLPLSPRVEGPEGEFLLAAPAPVARTEAGGAACGGRFYLVGGIGPFARTLSSLAAYDPGSGRWEELPDLPRPISHPGVVCAQGRLYVIGGFGPLGLRLRGFMFARWDPLSTVFIYDPGSKSWTQGPPLPEPRGAGGAAAAEGALWYAGGIDRSLSISAELFRLDIKDRTWRKMAPMPTARDHLRMEAVGGRLYAISGREDDLRRNLAVTERYDIGSGRWSRACDIPAARGGLGSAVMDGRIYTFGGERVWSCLSEVERYDPVMDRWETLGRLPEARHGICAGAIGGRLHLVSGGRHSRVSASAIHRVFTPRP